MSSDIFAWETDFPVGFGHTSIAYLKRCTGYEAAKAGDLDAAKFVVDLCVKDDRINALRQQFPEAKLLPVLTGNMLPFALALRVGLPIHIGVLCQHTAHRKYMNAMERVIHKPTFYGIIDTCGRYIIVDDVITQGGTVSALRRFVILHGGCVVAVLALAYSIGSHAIAPCKKYIQQMFFKFGFKLMRLLGEYRIFQNLTHMTNSQVKYFLKFSCVNNIDKRLRMVGYELMPGLAA